MKGSALFYVQLRDNFSEKIEESRAPGIFSNSDDPYLAAEAHLKHGSVYPVVKVISPTEIEILDDQGLPFQTPSSLYKFCETNSN